MKKLLTIVILLFISISAYYLYETTSEETTTENINTVQEEKFEEESKQQNETNKETITTPQGSEPVEAVETPEPKEALENKETNTIERNESFPEEANMESPEGVLDLMVSDSGCEIYKLISPSENETFNKELENDLECPMSTPSTSVDGRLVLLIPAYIRNSGTPALKLYDLAYERSEQLMTFYNDSTGIEFLGWNPTGDKLAIGVVNLNNSDYPEKTKLFILTFRDGAMISKDKYNIPMDYSCDGEECSPQEIIWDNEEYIEYETCSERPCAGGAITFEKKYLKTEAALSISAEDPLCKTAEEEYYPNVHPAYKHFDIGLGSIFTALACGPDRTQELHPDGVIGGNSDENGAIIIRMNSTPSSGLKEALLRANFIERDTDDWYLEKDTDINNIDLLRNYVDEDWVAFFAG